MKLLRNKTIRIGITVIVSTIFLYVAFRSLEWRAVLSSFQGYNLWWLVPVTMLVVFSIVLRAVRWKLILKPKEIKTSLLFEAIVLSFFTNILLPINIGEIVRAYILKKKTQIKMLLVFGSIAIERVISILGFLIVGFYAILFIPLPIGLDTLNSQAINGLRISAAIFVLFVVIILLAKKYRKNVLIFFRYLAHKVSRKHKNSIVTMCENFLLGLRFGGKHLIMIIVYSVLIRIVFAFITMSIARGFGVNLPLLTFLFIDVVVSFAYAIGSSVGILGTYEATLTYTLAFFGVAKEVGLGIALIADATFIIPSLALGFYYFLKEGLTFKKLKALGR